MKRYRRFAALLVAAVIAAGLAACSKTEEKEESSSLSVVSQAEDLSVFPKGVYAGSTSLEGKSLEEALSICRAEIEAELSELEITVKFKDDTVSLSGGDFEEKDVLEESLKKLLEERTVGEFDISYVVDLSEQGEEKLWQAAADCLVEGVDATVTGFDSSAGSFVFTDEQSGSRADVLSALKSVRQLLSQKKSGAIQASFIEIKAEETKESLSQRFGLISSYHTVSTNTENGNSNMALALSLCNGTVLQPGETFSYNAATGDSTDPSNGWKTAGGLAGGLSVQVYGGGICQGATTLYNAALMAGMEIIERDCHSSPSSYCPIGLDATIDYGNIDLKFKNVLDDPIYIQTWMDGVTLYANIYGCIPDDWDYITLYSEQTGYEEPLSEVSFKVDDSLEEGEYVRVSSGHSGYSARAWRYYYKDGEVVKTEELQSSYYAPTGPTYKVGPDTDTSKVDTTKESGTTDPEPTPTPTPTPEPTAEPTAEPTQAPTETPTESPTEAPAEAEPTVDSGAQET